ncbi:MAG: hypothetical protein HEQ38_20315 [Gemmatimonas sp.]|nr:hypothetical protein [Gemmatimonas sp.]
MDEQQQSDSNDFVRRRTTRLAHPLPSSRLLLEKQFLTLRAYGTRTRDRGLSMQELAKTVGVHESNLSTCNPFFVEVGLIERAEGGYKATPATVAYAEAAEWDEQTALEKLAPAFERSWLWQVIEPRIQFRPIEEDEAIRLLAEKTRASKELKPQVRLLLDYLVSVRLLTR